MPIDDSPMMDRFQNISFSCEIFSEQGQIFNHGASIVLITPTDYWRSLNVFLLKENLSVAL